MGLFLSKMLGYVFSGFDNDPARVLMLGLDAAGKTTILYKLKLNENVVTIPTIGFNVETVTIGKGISFTVWDIGGQEKLRALWRHYYPGTTGLIFVIDSSDKCRLREARDELFGILEHPDMNGVPVSVIANKQDLPGACSTSELAETLGLRDMRTHKWHIQSCCAITGDGIYEGMNQMAIMVKEFQRMKRSGYIS